MYVNESCIIYKTSSNLNYNINNITHINVIYKLFQNKNNLLSFTI